ncbi:hypothetical protein CC2G_011950 [Coprinopsis cinerea AmutBmut pab1-1]|nr:hypothetical protein CC2G_011950 [Coprinopsis cinerea AmutBmut pab1-1]
MHTANARTPEDDCSSEIAVVQFAAVNSKHGQRNKIFLPGSSRHTALVGVIRGKIRNRWTLVGGNHLRNLMSRDGTGSRIKWWLDQQECADILVPKLHRVDLSQIWI